MADIISQRFTVGSLSELADLINAHEESIGQLSGISAGSGETILGFDPGTPKPLRSIKLFYPHEFTGDPGAIACQGNVFIKGALKAVYAVSLPGDPTTDDD